MLKEISMDEAKKMALDGQEVFKIYLGCNGSRVQSVNQAIDEIFDETSRFLIDLPEEKPEEAGGAGREEKKEPEPKRKPGRKKRLKLDTGKIRALYNAGWSYDKIADEIGVSSSTIRRVIVKEDGKDGVD